MAQAALQHARSVPKHAKDSFRADIEGLRAVAALLVAGFHIWGNKVSGGVDVFFVVSGYFITLTLLRQVDQFGKVKPGAYLAHLAQRLGPTALAVLASTLVLAWTVLLPSARSSTFEHAIASLVQVENLKLAFQSVDYLAQHQPKSPVQQFWAMSVQVQFYVIWLLAVLSAVRLARRTDNGVRGELARIVGMLALLSFVWSIVQTTQNQAFAYFSPLTRIWEFALGTGVALVLPRLVIPRWLRITMIWAGLTGIITCAALLSVESSFPGYAALWPTASAALVLASGQKGDGLAANAFLNHRVLVWTGGFAFAIYLWHWPLLITARVILGRQDLGITPGVVVIVVAVALAWATTRWIERPWISAARSGSPRKRRGGNVLLAGAFVALLASFVGSLVTTNLGNAKELEQSNALDLDSVECFGANAVLNHRPGCREPGLGNRLLPPGPVSEDLPKPEADVDCAVRRWHVEARMCAYGKVGSDTRIGLIGNSHAIAWFPALERIASEQGWELRVWYKNGCQFASRQRIGASDWGIEECAAWVENVRTDVLAGPKIRWIMTSANGRGTWGDESGAPSPTAAAAALSNAWRPLIDAGIEIVAIRDYPYSSDDSLACVEREGMGAVDACAVPRGGVLGEHDQMFEHAVSLKGAYGVDLTDAFCNATICWTAAGHVKVYRDHSHLSNTYAESTWQVMRDRLAEQGLMTP